MLKSSRRKGPAWSNNRRLDIKTWKRGCMPSNQLASILHPLCYEHHTKMNLAQIVSGNDNPLEKVEHACQVSDCFVRYTHERGYFIASRNGPGLQEERLPQVRCPHDGALMYLGEVRPEERSFRLWRCPLCKAASISGQARATST